MCILLDFASGMFCEIITYHSQIIDIGIIHQTYSDDPVFVFHILF